ncbi:MAG: hypothetical protein GVY17_13330 [Cyanobacteria bacterium]|nr:hypothetical protein [Cyanobacteria bacterium GSL.Bin21]
MKPLKPYNALLEKSTLTQIIEILIFSKPTYTIALRTSLPHKPKVLFARLVLFLLLDIPKRQQTHNRDRAL